MLCVLYYWLARMQMCHSRDGLQVRPCYHFLTERSKSWCLSISWRCECLVIVIDLCQLWLLWNMIGITAD